MTFRNFFFLQNFYLNKLFIYWNFFFKLNSINNIIWSYIVKNSFQILYIQKWFFFNIFNLHKLIFKLHLLIWLKSFKQIYIFSFIKIPIYFHWFNLFIFLNNMFLNYCIHTHNIRLK